MIGCPGILNLLEHVQKQNLLWHIIIKNIYVSVCSLMSYASARGLLRLIHYWESPPSWGVIQNQCIL